MITWILGAIAFVLLVFTNTGLDKKLKEYLTTKKPQAKPVSEPDYLPEPPKKDILEDPPIYEIVKQWHVLKELCEKAKLGESVKSLDTVFLNLLKKEHVNAKSDN